MIKSGFAIGGPVSGKKLSTLHGRKLLVPFRGKDGWAFATYHWHNGEWIYADE